MKAFLKTFKFFGKLLINTFVKMCKAIHFTRSKSYDLDKDGTVDLTVSVGINGQSSLHSKQSIKEGGNLNGQEQTKR